MGWACTQSGQFGEEDGLPLYWGRTVAQPEHAWPEGTTGFPFIVRVDSELAGFVLINQTCSAPSQFTVGAFFILRKFRRSGVGTDVCRQLFSMFSGAWTIGSMVGNTPANSFWRYFIQRASRNQFAATEEMDDSGRFKMIVHRFESSCEMR
jgi:predicted acetyltransferase